MSIRIEAHQGEYHQDWGYVVIAYDYDDLDDEQEIGRGGAYYFAFDNPEQVVEAADNVSQGVYEKAVAFTHCLDGNGSDGIGILDDEPVFGLVILDSWRVDKGYRGKGVGYEMARALYNMPWPLGTVFVLFPGPLLERGDKQNPDAVAKLEAYWAKFGFRPLSDKSAVDGLTLYGHHNHWIWPKGSYSAGRAG